MELRSLIDNFTNRLVALIEEQAIERARAAVTVALGASEAHRAGRVPALGLAAASKKPRRKGPKQLCPVPGCKNPAAPVFGMVCADHKNVSKAKLKKYRAARRAAKLKKAA